MTIRVEKEAVGGEQRVRVFLPQDSCILLTPEQADELYRRLAWVAAPAQRERIDRLSYVVGKLAGGAGMDISEMIEEEWLKEGDLS